MRKLSSYSFGLRHDMTTHLMAKSTVAIAALTTLVSALVAAPAWGQNFPITPDQRQTANQVADKGVPLNELAASAPDRYTVKSGDTLWAISGLFLKRAWRWPELWGMNLSDIKNPHLIYPGQILVLERKNGVARLRVEGAQVTDEAPTDTVRVSPRTRYEALPNGALSTLQPNVIEAFLSEAIIVDEMGLRAAPRIVSTQEGRVMVTTGDRAYARGPSGKPLMDDQPQLQQFRIFRSATPLKDPTTGEVLGYEAQYVGKATLVRGETTAEIENKDGSLSNAVVPATIDIMAAKAEMRTDDRMLPEPPRQLQTYTPHAPEAQMSGRIVSVYGDAVVNAAQNQVVAINRGTRDGMEVGHVMAILKDGARMVDKSDEARPVMKLPNERNGLLMVFRTFDRLSYALILEITDGVRVGDRLTNPR